MSLAGIHFSFSPKHNNFSGYLASCHNAGSPLALVFSVNQDVATDIRKHSPSTLAVFRYKDTSSNKNGNGDDWPVGQGDPTVAGRSQMDKAYAKFRLNSLHDFFSATNELNPSNEQHHHWAAAYYLSQMQRANELGIKVVWGNFSAGTPDYNEWPYYDNCVRFSAEHGHVLGLHEYGLQYGAMRHAPDDLVLRYRKVYASFKQRGLPWTKLIISECGPGGYISGRDLEDVVWYDEQLTADRLAGLPILGCAFYQWGMDEAAQFVDLAPRFFEYVKTHPTPVPSPDWVTFDGRVPVANKAEFAQQAARLGVELNLHG